MGGRKFPVNSHQRGEEMEKERREINHLRMKPLYRDWSRKMVGGELGGKRGIYQFAPVRGCCPGGKFEGTTNDSGERKKKMVSHFSGFVSDGLTTTKNCPTLPCPTVNLPVLS